MTVPMKTTPRVRDCLRAAHTLYPLGKEQSEDILALLDDFATLEAELTTLREQYPLRFTAADGEMLLRVITCAGYYSDETFDDDHNGLCDPLDDGEMQDARALRESVRRQLRGGYQTSLRLEQPWQSVITEGGKQEEVRIADKNLQPDEEIPT